MADLSRDDVLKLARLARLSLTDDEITAFTSELAEILHYVEQLDKVDTSSLEPTSQVTGLVNVMRPDTEKSYGYEPRELLKNVPKTENNQIKVNRMIN